MSVAQFETSVLLSSDRLPLFERRTTAPPVPARFEKKVLWLITRSEAVWWLMAPPKALMAMQRSKVQAVRMEGDAAEPSVLMAPPLPTAVSAEKEQLRAWRWLLRA